MRTSHRDIRKRILEEKSKISDEEFLSYAAEQGYDDVETFKKEVDTEELKESILLEKVTELLVSSAKVSEVEN